MRVTTGKVVGGRIEVPGESFAEGSTITVLASENDEAFSLGPEEESALLSAMAEGDHGEVISADADAQVLPVPPSHQEELDRRLADFEANPEAGSSWEEVRRRLERQR